MVRGQLLAPEDDAENELIFTYLQSKGYNETRSYEFFLGINDGMTEGEYKFDNSPLEVGYMNFGSDAEANAEGLNEVVYKYPEKTWTRRSTSAIGHAICVRFPGTRAMTKAQKDPENNVNGFLNEGHIAKMEAYLQAHLDINTVTVCP